MEREIAASFVRKCGKKEHTLPVTAFYLWIYIVRHWFEIITQALVWLAFTANVRMYLGNAEGNLHRQTNVDFAFDKTWELTINW